jgi:hypothetical protein
MSNNSYVHAWIMKFQRLKDLDCVIKNCFYLKQDLTLV